jgi:UDP-N-acetylmuramoyl-L-alanyl-D-glutamate--2,6-diaminopimelate ligase
MIGRLKKLIPERHPLRLAWHRVKGFFAAMRHGFPSRRLSIIAVTGTDGKTTTVSMIAHILRHAGRSVGAVSTTFFRINDAIEWNPTHKTSLPPFAFQKFLRRCVREGMEFTVVEASSHGLVQGRLGPLRPEVAAITNTSLEHLDYHGSMERYRADKALLFRMLRGRGTKVLNAEDETFPQYRAIPSDRTIAFARSANPDADVWLSDARATPSGVSAALHIRHSTFDIQLRIPGLFNLENALCAISSAHAVGIAAETSVEALRSFQSVPGRLERIDEGQPFSVFVDFTVTPLAYERTFEAVRAMTPQGRILVLASCCGDRMREKRPVIGRICSERADVVVITTDETITEDPLAVIDEVWAGVDQSRTKAAKIPDRREAINFLFQEARPGDAVLLCGMGACTTMQTREGLIPWDERKVARELLRNMRKS